MVLSIGISRLFLLSGRDELRPFLLAQIIGQRSPVALQRMVVPGRVGSSRAGWRAGGGGGGDGETWHEKRQLLQDKLVIIVSVFCGVAIYSIYPTPDPN
jgi:hypothetical protein